MLTVWVVALIEVIEAPDLCDDVLADCIGQRVNACGQYDLAGDESAPQHVVQFADGGEAHCEPPSSSVTGRMNITPWRWVSSIGMMSRMRIPPALSPLRGQMAPISLGRPNVYVPMSSFPLMREKLTRPEGRRCGKECVRTC